MITKYFPRFLVLALVVFAVTACECYNCEYHPPGLSYVRMAPTAPPPPQVEAVPMNQSPRTLYWRPGYWRYTDAEFQWVPGEYLNRPSPTAVWSPERWVDHQYGWVFYPGYWQ